MRETSANEPLTTHRNRTQTTSKPECPACSGNSMEETYLLAMRCPVYRRRDSHPGFRTELENLDGNAKGEGPSGSPARPTVPMCRTGADCSVVAMSRGNSRGAKGRVTESGSTWVNWQQEEPDDLGGRRRPSTGGTSRVTGDGQARICERLGAKFLGPTRQQETELCQTGLRRALRKQRLRMPPGDYRYCACSRLHSLDLGWALRKREARSKNQRRKSHDRNPRLGR